MSGFRDGADLGLGMGELQVGVHHRTCDRVLGHGVELSGIPTLNTNTFLGITCSCSCLLRSLLLVVGSALAPAQMQQIASRPHAHKLSYVSAICLRA